MATFCVDYISVSGTEQTFCAGEPCGDPGSRCKHVTIMIQAESILNNSLPLQMELASINCIKSSTDELDAGSSGYSSTILLFPKCRRSRSRYPRTTVHDAEDNWANCSHQYEFNGSIAEASSISEDSDTSTERAASEAGESATYDDGN